MHSSIICLFILCNFLSFYFGMHNYTRCQFYTWERAHTNEKIRKIPNIFFKSVSLRLIPTSPCYWTCKKVLVLLSAFIKFPYMWEDSSQVGLDLVTVAILQTTIWAAQKDKFRSPPQASGTWTSTHTPQQNSVLKLNVTCNSSWASVCGQDLGYGQHLSPNNPGVKTKPWGYKQWLVCMKIMDLFYSEEPLGYLTRLFKSRYFPIYLNIPCLLTKLHHEDSNFGDLWTKVFTVQWNWVKYVFR